MANPGNGYIFDRWIGADSGLCADINSRVCASILMDADKQIKARFNSVNCPEDGASGGCPVCNDGVDNDEDGFMDWDGFDSNGDGHKEFPADIACGGLPNNTSEDVGNQCDDCGVDNDNDGFSDYPSDTGCYALDDPNETNAVLTVDIERLEGANGRVTAQPGEIDCDLGNCEATFIRDETVTLTATPIPLDGPSQFWNWSDPDQACVGSEPVCEVTMDQSRNITASFGISAPPDPNTLTVNIWSDGRGDGKVVTLSGNLTCLLDSPEDDCKADYYNDETVTLVATPLPLLAEVLASGGDVNAMASVILAQGEGEGEEGESVFWNWVDESGNCTGSSPVCEVTMTDDWGSNCSLW